MNEEIIESSIGKFPINWNILPLSKISTIVTGTTPKTVVKEYYDGNFPWITPSDINSRKNIYDSPRKLTSLGLSKSRILPPNTLLITCIASIGKNAILRKKGSCNQQINAILPSENHDVDFLYYVMNYSTPRLLNLAGTTAVALINKSTFSKFEIALPPMQQQQRIAEILNTVDEKIEVIEQQIIKTQELKKGLMQRLLTKGIGHTEFKESPLGIIPKSWEVVELDEISSTTRLAGYEYSEYWEESIDGEITALRGYNIGKNKLLLHNVIKISEELSQKLVRSRLFKGDVVFPCVGTIGNAIVIKEDNKYHINQNIAKITPDKNLDSYFLMQYLISPMCKNEIKRFNATTSQPNVLVGSLRKFRIPFTSNKNEQIKISTILGCVDEKLEILSEKKTHYQKLKQGLMQQLLTGKIRVKV